MCNFINSFGIWQVCFFLYIKKKKKRSYIQPCDRVVRHDQITRWTRKVYLGRMRAQLSGSIELYMSPLYVVIYSIRTPDWFRTCSLFFSCTRFERFSDIFYTRTLMFDVCNDVRNGYIWRKIGIWIYRSNEV